MRIYRVLVAGTVVVAALLQGQAAHAATFSAVWHMDDTGATMSDSTGHGLTGTLTGVTPGAPGAVGTAFQFGARPAYVRVASSPLLNPGSSTFTVSVRVRFSVRPSTAVGDYDLVRKGLLSTKGGDWKVEILPTGYAFCLFRGSAGTVSIKHGPNLADNRWHTIACRRSGSTVRLTVDGSSWTASGSTGTISNSSSVLLGAKGSAGEDQYAGLLDEVTVSTG
jgi:hypothetical protein